MNISVLNPRPSTEIGFSPAGSAVSLRGVTKSFDRHEVLHGISLDIQPGQFVAIVGRSGCGKSTLLRLLAGLDQPTRGKIEIDGRSTGWVGGRAVMFLGPRAPP